MSPSLSERSSVGGERLTLTPTELSQAQAWRHVMALISCMPEFKKKKMTTMRVNKCVASLWARVNPSLGDLIS